MIEIRHEKLNIEKPYRCIVVSDFHSQSRTQRSRGQRARR